MTGLQNSISLVQDMLQNRQLENLSHFWEQNGQPVCQIVHLGERTVEVPLLALVSHSQLAMDTVEVKFSTRVGSVAAGRTSDLLTARNLGDEQSGSGVLSHADLQVAMGGVKADGEDTMEVFITFKIKDTPEAVSRLVDEYNTRI